MSYINNSHLKKHQLTPLQFKDKYPNFNNISHTARKLMGGDKTNAVIANKKKAMEIKESEKEKFLLSNKCCLNCNTPITFEKKHNKFCNKSCSATYNNKNRVVIYSKKGYENLKKIGKKNSIYFRNKELTNEEKIIKYKNIKRSPFMFLKCVICNNSMKVKSYMAHKKTCSISCKRIQHSLNNYRQNKTYGKCGYYKGIYCASSWELAFLVYNKDLGKDIKRCDIQFTYSFNNEEHTYFPDFIMEDVIYEVKGRELEDVVFKTEAVIKNGYKIQLIRRKEILPIIKEIKTKYNLKDITKLYDKV